MGKKEENTHFICVVCQHHVKALLHGSYRNHCPFCLSSLHVDDAMPGDRNSSCLGVMKAIGLKYHAKKGWQIVHNCMKCGTEKLNKIAEGDDQSDDWSQVIRLSQEGK